MATQLATIDTRSRPLTDAERARIRAGARQREQQLMRQLDTAHRRKVQQLTMTLQSLMSELNAHAEVMVDAWEEHGQRRPELFQRIRTAHGLLYSLLQREMVRLTGRRHLPGAFGLLKLQQQAEKEAEAWSFFLHQCMKNGIQMERC